MGLKDAFDNLAKSAADALGNTKDAASEATHRAAAEAEAQKRDLAGDNLSVGDKLSSVVEQAKHATLAEVDAAKQKMRE